MRAALVALSLALAAAPSAAQDNGGMNPAARDTEITVELSAEDKEAIVSGVVEYFKRNPAELVEAIVAWRQRSTPTPLGETDPIAGNPAGDVTVIEFIDHSCAPCRDASTRLAKAAAADGNVKVVRKDFPVSSEESVNASLYVLAAVRSGGSWDSASASLAASGRLDHDSIMDAIRASGVKTVPKEALAAARESIAANREMAARLGIRSLPAMAVLSGEKVQVITGNLSEAEIAASLKQVRQAGRKR